MRSLRVSSIALLVLAASLTIAGDTPPAAPSLIPVEVFEGSGLAKRYKELFPTLVAALKDDDEQVRSTAADALRLLGGEAVPGLTDLLKGKDRRLKIVAAVILGRMGQRAESALPALLQTLKDGTETKPVQRAAATAIRNIIQNDSLTGQILTAGFAIGEDRPDLRVQGTWERKRGDYTLTLRLLGGRLRGTVTGPTPTRQTLATVEADYAVTKDYTLYGVFTTLDMPPEIKKENNLEVRSAPFCAHVRVEGSRLMLRQVNISGATAKEDGEPRMFDYIEGRYERKRSSDDEFVD